MKTHDLADTLTLLAKLLRNSPNTEVESFSIAPKERKPKETTVKEVPMREAPASATALSSLVAFSTFNKQQWSELIKNYSIPIEIKSTYSSRDIMGKIMNYFAENSEAKNTLIHKLESQNEKASPELMRALSVLLRN